MKHGAEFSECGKYRYVLWRIWDDEKPFVQCIGLNPSTANALDNDPTIESLLRILKNLGYGGLYMTNLFALISPYPADLQECADPVKDNDYWLFATSEKCREVVFCWGNFKQAQWRVKQIIPKISANGERFPPIKCFGKNKNGSPKHPLYMRATTQLIKF